MSNVPPPPPPPPPPYGATPPAYGGDSSVREYPGGTTILVLGILSLVICSILGPIAWVKGNTAKKAMDAQPGVTWSNRGAITAGRICGMIASILIVVGIVIGIIAVAAGS